MELDQSDRLPIFNLSHMKWMILKIYSVIIKIWLIIIQSA